MTKKTVSKPTTEQPEETEAVREISVKEAKPSIRYTKKELLQLREAPASSVAPKELFAEVRLKSSFNDRLLEPKMIWQPIGRGDGQPKLENETTSDIGTALDEEDVFDELLEMLDKPTMKFEVEQAQTVLTCPGYGSAASSPAKGPPPPLEPLGDDIDDEDDIIMSIPEPPQLLKTVPSGLTTPVREPVTPGQTTVGTATPVPSPSPSRGPLFGTPAQQARRSQSQSPASSLGYSPTNAMTPPPAQDMEMMQQFMNQARLGQQQGLFPPSPQQLSRQAALLQLQRLQIQQQQLMAGQADLRRHMMMQAGGGYSPMFMRNGAAPQQQRPFAPGMTF
eukprot:TRINITY_DN710_c2_g1_i1.p1 TRINITY_DN710_c2_g1~~TRINITY_DN710_c2_g1_i1.p1  ORF type:complete len:335 (+),score=85.72 TRINITY_DN710_c2_g1_i1:81-1085(+)